MGASARIFETLDDRCDMQIGIEPKSGSDIIQEAALNEAFDGSLSFNKVNFAYPARPEYKVLRDISFRIDKGKKFALVGPSGAGK